MNRFSLLRPALAALAAAVLTACGGGGSDAEPVPPASVDLPAPTSLVVIGNSITLHPINESIQWTHASGMAASDAAHDYAHLVAAGLGLSTVSARNVAVLERAETADLSLIPSATSGIDARTAVVLQLGDNAVVTGSPAFTASYSALLAAVSARQSLVCLSTWWWDSGKDAMIKAQCEAHGGRYVFIGDIYPTRADVIPAGENPAVVDHPHDPSMAVIAQRVLAVFGHR